MSFTLTDVARQAAALLNDAPQDLFTFDVLLPFMKKSFEEMVLTLDMHQVQVQTNSVQPLTVPANTLILSTVTITDFLYPLKMEEKLTGEGDNIPYDPMEERSFIDNIAKIDRLRFWSWNGDVIKFPGSTASRNILLYYVKMFTTPTDGVTPIDIKRVNLYMESRTAAIAALLILQDTERASALDNDAERWLDMVVRIMTRTKQALYARRKPFGKRWTSPKRIIIS